MTRAEVEALAEALAPRVAEIIVGEIVDESVELMRTLENTMGVECDRIKDQIIRELKEPK